MAKIRNHSLDFITIGEPHNKNQFPELRILQTPNPTITNAPKPMNWREKLPITDPNLVPAEAGVVSPMSVEREEARPTTDTGQKRNPWLYDGNMKIKPQILKSNLLLPNVQGRVEGDMLCLDPTTSLSRRARGSAY